jgi:YVTN family beta-propeller protein
MIRVYSGIVILLFAGLFLSDCKKDKALANFGGYPNEVGKIMTLKCAVSGCHNSASYLASAGLDLSTWDAMFRGSSTGSSVIPFRSDFSSLCYFINSYPDLGNINYPTMPYNASQLSREEVLTIKNWINDGAPDLNGNVKWADNPQRRKIYVTNQGCDVVTVIDAETQLPMRFITVGKDPNSIEVPHMVRVSPDGQYWYVVFVNANVLQKYRCSDDVLVGEANLGLYFDWNALTISNDGTRAYCVSWVSNGHIASVDLTQMKTITNYGGYFFPHGVVLNETNDTLYVTGQTGNYLMKIDTSLATTQTITLNGLPPSAASSLDPHEVILSKDKKDLYITCQGSNEVRVYNIASNTITQVIPVGTYPVEMALSESKNKLYVTCEEDVTSFPGTHGTVSEILLGGTYPERRIAVGSVPHGIAVDDVSGLLYVASRNILSSGPPPHHSSVCAGRNGYVSLVDINSFTLKGKHCEISVDPYGAAIRK